MEQQELLKKYAYYYLVLQNMGDIPFKKDIVLATDTGINRKEIQMAYNDIKKFNFDGSIIDYLCWLSTAFLVYEAKKNLSFEKGSIPAMATSELDIAGEKNKSDRMNMFRLFNKNPDYLMNLLEEIFFEKKFNDFEYVEVFIFIKEHQTMLFFREKKIVKKVLDMVREANSAKLGTFYKINRLSKG